MLTEAIVASVIAGSSVCSDHFENTSRFNPTDLSDYQQCVLAAHNGESAGTLGGVFWVKTGETEFVSMPVSTLQKAGSASAAKAVVMDAIIEEVIVERIVEITVENGATIDRLRAEIRGFEAAQTAILENLGVEAGADALASIQNKIDMMQADILRLMGIEVEDGHRSTVSSTSHDNVFTVIGGAFAGTYTNAGAIITTSEISYQNEFDVTVTIPAATVLTQAEVLNHVTASGAGQFAMGHAAGFLAGDNGHDSTVVIALDAMNPNGGTATVQGVNSGTYYINGEDGHRSTISADNEGRVTVTGRTIVSHTLSGNTDLFTQDYVETAVSNALNSDANAFTQKYIARTALAEAFNASVADTTVPLLTGESLHNYIRNNTRTLIANLPAGTTDRLMPNGQNVDTATNTDIVSYGASNKAGNNGFWSDSESYDSVGGNFQYNSGLNATTFSYVTIDGRTQNAILRGVDASIARILNGIVDSAYDEGYDDGYADGYRDGFDDGVASVN